jgi:hypothetical protein
VVTDVLYAGELFAPENVGVLGAEGVTPATYEPVAAEVADAAPEIHEPCEFVTESTTCR